MKQMSLIEMDGFLKGKFIPSDLKVNETNTEYLVRKFTELESKLETALRECRSAGITIDNLEAKCAALAADNEKAMEAMRQADAAVKLAHEKFSAMAAENAGLKQAFNPAEIPEEAVEAFTETAIMDHDWNDTSEWSWVENDTDVIRAVLEAIKPETPTTDAFLAEVRAQGVDMFAQKCNSKSAQSFASDIRDNWKLLGEHATDFAAELRKGGNQ
ncbi:hNH endonuclease [Escherichia coli]|uniref:hNH endonuclease n=1 Tax=Escherichia coli TaxID=562 RepID=UPI000BB8A178|nr:hNH endonuclease [Escherichia coli]EFN9582531.1 hNH endonuclease [Escherichia coli]PBU04350.1 hNH endonuclease [Escherichia coli]PBU14029.1 hNH endonuclease [Escherichia coli]